jgi:hypothetical protein
MQATISGVMLSPLSRRRRQEKRRPATRVLKIPHGISVLPFVEVTNLLICSAVLVLSSRCV